MRFYKVDAGKQGNIPMCEAREILEEMVALEQQMMEYRGSSRLNGEDFYNMWKALKRVLGQGAQRIDPRMEAV